jgi:hypothetical protein
MIIERLAFAGCFFLLFFHWSFAFFMANGRSLIFPLLIEGVEACRVGARPHGIKT